MEEKLEISKTRRSNALELTVSGRIDAYWAQQLAGAIDEEVHAGSYSIILDLAGVSFMSSAGIRVLVQYYKQLKSLNGSLFVASPSESVRKVLAMAGLDQLIAQGEPEAAEPTGETQPALRRANVSFVVRPLNADARLRCRTIGNPELLKVSGFAEKDCRVERFPESSFGLGLGAIGNDFEDCRSRFGEFIALGGVAAYHPTDGTDRPDYVLSTGRFVPELRLLYGLVCDGRFSHIVKFEAERGTQAPLDALASALLEISGTESAGLAVVTETAGLVGAILSRSPFAGARAASPFSFPEVRDWVNFTTERAYPHTLAVVVGVVTRAPGAGLARFVRPLSSSCGLYGHFHAAVFPYHPLKKDVAELSEVVGTLFDSEQVLSVTHLLDDDREIVGVGQSEFLKGTCWLAGIAEQEDRS